MNTKYKTGQIVYYIEKLKNNRKDTYGLLIKALTITDIYIKDNTLKSGYYFGITVTYGFLEIENQYEEKELIKTLEEVYNTIKYEFE